MFGRRRRDYEALIAARQQASAAREVYAQFCAERAPYLIRIAQEILRAANIREPEFYDKGYPMTEGFNLGVLNGEVLLSYHKNYTPEETLRQMTLQLVSHLQAEAAFVGCVWPVRDFTGPNSSAVILELPTDEEIRILWANFVRT